MTTSDALSPQKERFYQELRTVLNGLYDPAILRGSSLLIWFGLDQQRDPVGNLRQILTSGIESLQPSDSTPLRSKTWRSYQILRRRYTEQRMQREVADDLGLSIRQMQREEKVAREMLGDYLWKVYHLADRPAPPPLNSNQKPNPNYDEEAGPGEAGLEALAESVPAEMADVRAILTDALLTLSPVLTSAGVRVQPPAETEAIPLLVRAPLLRQAVLNLIHAAAGQAPGGDLTVRLVRSALQVQILVETHTADAPAEPISGLQDSLQMATELVRLCDGQLALVRQPHTFQATLSLPVVGEVRVLVVEDHADTVQLYRRYLADSPYQVIGAQSAREALEMIESIHPQIIILDVMMPDVDGWTLLGQLRVHPQLQGVPILICSIIPQERLAISLGADEFLHKPISQTELLAALDRQLNLPAKGSG